MMKNSQGRATLASTGLGLLLVPTICLAEDGPLAVTRLETTVIGIGEGVTLDEIFSVPGTPAADLEECLSVDFSTSQGASNLGACFSVNAGTTFQADIAYTPADPTEDAGIIGSAYLILSILEETDVVIDGMGSEGLAWTIRGPLDLDIDASSQETVLLPAGEYVLQSRMSWGSLIPNQLLITSLTEDALRLNEISAYGEVVYSGAVAESSTLSDLEGIPIEMNVTSSGEVPDCADSNELESTISFTVTPGFGIPGPGLLASGIADE